MNLKHKNFQASNVKVLDSAQGIIEAIVSVCNSIDCYGERILPGFFAESLKTRTAKGVWGHDWLSPVARTLEQRELAPGDPLLPTEIRSLGGLYIKGQFNLNTQRGREAFSDIEFGIIDEFSIGFTIEESSYDAKNGVLDLIVGTLYEWSPVLVGANPDTALISVKSAQAAQQKLQGKLAELKTKGAMLGDVETTMTLAAISELDWALWGCIYDLFYYNNDALPLTNKIASLGACFNEFRDTALRVIQAILGASGEAGQEQKAAAALEVKAHLDTLAASLQAAPVEVAPVETGTAPGGDDQTATNSLDVKAHRQRQANLLQYEADLLNLTPVS